MNVLEAEGGIEAWLRAEGELKTGRDLQTWDGASGTVQCRLLNPTGALQQLTLSPCDH